MIQRIDYLLLVQLTKPKVISESTTGRGPGLGREKKRRKTRLREMLASSPYEGDCESWSAEQQADRRQSTERPAEDEGRAKQTVKEEKTERKDEGKKRDRDNSGGEVNVCIQLQYGIVWYYGTVPMELILIELRGVI